MQLSQQPDVSFAHVRQVMERDPLIAASVLRMAQSSAYATAGAVRTLDEALMRLGLKTLGCFFLEAAVKLKVFRAPGYEAPMKALTKHSAAAAHLARHLARRTSLFDEYSFMCGLLHDIGIAAGLIALSAGAKKDEIPSLAEVWPAVREAHELASEMVCRAWGLTPDIALVCGNHHACRVGGHIHPVAAVVALADFISAELGCGLDESTVVPGEAILKTLGLTPRELAPLVAECKPVVEASATV
jgi:HD-like signal output (HDOD) protein